MTEVDALVLAAGRGERLALGVKALLALGDRTLLDRAIAIARSVAGRVIVGVPEECVEHVRTLYGADVVVLAGGRTRQETMLRLFRASTAPVIVQHDVVHPFATAALARRVVAATLDTGAAMAAVRTGGYVYRGGDQLRERVGAGDALWEARKPFAFHRTALAGALDAQPAIAGHVGSAEALLAAGRTITIVPAPSWHIKITTPSDWKLAGLIEAAIVSGALAEDEGP
jgi:2-C-methyl-D-erythritol 4-phosphate cytidylyltransferase